MPSIKHGQVDDDAAQQATLEGAEEESCGDQAPKRLGKAEEGTHEPPCRDQGWQVNASSDALDDPIAGHVDKDIGNVEDEQSNVEFGARLHPQILCQSVDFGIADVGPVNESKKPFEPVSYLESPM